MLSKKENGGRKPVIPPAQKIAPIKGKKGPPVIVVKGGDEEEELRRVIQMSRMAAA